MTICINNKQNILSEIHHEIVSNPVGASCARPKVELSPIGIQIDKEINKIDKEPLIEVPLIAYLVNT